MRTKLHAPLAATFLGLTLLTIPGGLSVSAAIPQATTVHVVKIVNTKNGLFAFKPSTIKIRAKTRITWINVTGTDHTASARTFRWNTGTIRPHKRATVTFKKIGTFHYFCQFHSFMRGVVKVVR